MSQFFSAYGTCEGAAYRLTLQRPEPLGILGVLLDGRQVLVNDVSH
jgi:hypothetical protein